MTYTVDQVIAQYIKLRDQKAELAAKHKDELKPLSDAMDSMEAWLLNKLNTDGVESFKTAEGTAFKAHTASVSMSDGVVFKSFVFAPAVQAFKDYFETAGFELEPHDLEHVATILQDSPLWSLTDFRAAKKGIQEYIEEKQIPVPGVSVTPILNVNIRRS